MLCEFKLGDKFYSYEEAEKKVHQFGENTCTTFWKRDARTIGASRKKLSKTRHIDEQLIYYQLMFACTHGGQKSRKRGTNQRRTSTLKEECPVNIRFTASLDGRSLEITSLCLQHNHEPGNKSSHKRIKRRRTDKIANEKIKEENLEDPSANDAVDVAPNCSPQSFIERRKEALAICIEIADLIAQDTGALYEERMNVLHNLKSYLASGVPVEIVSLKDMVDDVSWKVAAVFSEYTAEIEKQDLAPRNDAETVYDDPLEDKKKL